MKSSLPLADARQRQLALNPNESFIVQAPAGSGKTELLVRRFLVLLTCVSVPEAIVAITFTRKAANEMRLRIMQSLALALSNKTPADSDKERYELAKKVLIQDKALAWHLLSNPNRLRILTIDSFCLYLTRQMPLLSGLSETLTPLEHPEYLYRLAIQALIQQLEDKVAWQASLSHLLSHLDNDFQRIEALFIPMLARREQWLDFLLQHQQHLREDLEQALLNINHDLVKQLNGLVSQDMAARLFQQLNFSLQQRQQPLLIRHDDLNFWQAASQLLLTKSDSWRKKLTQAEGFAVPDKLKNTALKNEVKTHKEQCLNLITELSQLDLLRETLMALKQAPPLRYSDSQWQIIQSLFELLPVLVAHLKVVFQQQKKLDYTEISLAASAALGQTDNPSDLALILDYQIQHLLVDEFQDTSATQFQLIEKLTAGWQPQESRSLFLVGDPMQSIYRFRKAEVGLFSQVQHLGIGNIQLQSLSLSVNFRSTSGIIEWVNQQFSQLLANASNGHHEPVCYAPATAYSQTQQPQAAVCTYWQQAANDDSDLAEITEAEQLVKIIQTLKRENNHATIAILIRARSHLRHILPALQKAAITYRAIAIDSLADKSAVQDLLSLTRALHHLGDRIAWFALLHSPYCGLSLSDLYQISQFETADKSLPTLWQQLQHFEEISLNLATKKRLRRIVPVLQQSLYKQGRLPFTGWVKQTWLALGGPTTLLNEEEMDHIQAYFNFLENKIEQQGEALDFFNLDTELAHIYAQTTTPLPSHAVEIMTIHQAKGLEYDHVILPGLHRQGRSEQAALLLFCEMRFTSQKKQFLLAPIKASHEEKDGIYNYLNNEEKKKNAAELTRLLYVACTRAKQSLHLLGTLNCVTPEEVKSAPTNSLLGQLWPVMAIKPQRVVAAPVKDTAISSPQGLLKRLPADWQAPYSAQLDLYSNAKNLPSVIKPASDCYRWQLYPERGLGIVIHQLLYQISQEGLARWNKERILTAQPMLLGLLRQQGLLAEQLPNALATLKRCLETTLADPRGRWILSSQHQAAQSEYAITALLNNQPKNLVIDRTFIEATTGITWIIDYKTRDYQGKQPEEFLNLGRKQHQPQLNTYAQALMLQESYRDPLRCGLYFPLCSLWCEWEFNEISLTESNR